MAARQVLVYVINSLNVDLVLEDGSAQLSHGIWSDGAMPPARIPANGFSQFQSESSGFMTGTEGTVAYRLDTGPAGNREVIRLHWDNPWVWGPDTRPGDGWIDVGLGSFDGREDKQRSDDSQLGWRYNVQEGPAAFFDGWVELEPLLPPLPFLDGHMAYQVVTFGVTPLATAADVLPPPTFKSSPPVVVVGQKAVSGGAGTMWRGDWDDRDGTGNPDVLVSVPAPTVYASTGTSAAEERISSVRMSSIAGVPTLEAKETPTHLAISGRGQVVGGTVPAYAGPLHPASPTSVVASPALTASLGSRSSVSSSLRAAPALLGAVRSTSTPQSPVAVAASAAQTRLPAAVFDLEAADMVTLDDSASIYLYVDLLSSGETGDARLRYRRLDANGNPVADVMLAKVPPPIN